MRYVWRVARRGEGGFTLVELLVVVVILGILSAVVVFSVRGVGDKGTAAATATDERIIRTALETHCALHGEYADGQGLVDAQLLSELPRRHSVITTDDPPYEGECGNTPGKRHYRITCILEPDCSLVPITDPLDLDLAMSTYFDSEATLLEVYPDGTGSGLNRGPQVAVDPAGNTYMAVGHMGGGGPIQAASNPRPRQSMVAKFGADGQLIYSTYVGGGSSQIEDIAVDGAGNVYVAGTDLSSADPFPTTPNAYRPTNPYSPNPFPSHPVYFLMKLDPLGVPVYSTFLWPTREEPNPEPGPAGVALLGPDKVLVTGRDHKFTTQSSEVNPFRAPCTGADVASGFRSFVSLLDTSLVGGASHLDSICMVGGRDLAVSGSSVYAVGDGVAGTSLGVWKLAVESSKIVVKANAGTGGFAVATALDGSQVYVLGRDSTTTRLNASLGDPFEYAPKPAGQVLGIAGGPRGFLYQFGYGASTSVTGPPLSASSKRSYGGGANDAFVIIRSPGGAVPFATYLGGDGPAGSSAAYPGGNDKGTAVAVTATGDVHLVGVTNSTDFPTTDGAFQRTKANPRPDFLAVFVSRFKARR